MAGKMTQNIGLYMQGTFKHLTYKRMKPSSCYSNAGRLSKSAMCVLLLWHTQPLMSTSLVTTDFPELSAGVFVRTSGTEVATSYCSAGLDVQTLNFNRGWNIVFTYDLSDVSRNEAAGPVH